MFQQKKCAEELANGMDVRNAALEKLGHKVKEEEIITASAEAAGDEAASWAAKCAEQKPKFPSRALCYSVSVALQALPAVKMQQQENQQLELEERVRTAAVLKSRNTEKQAKEVANINKQREAGRAGSAKAILAKAMQKWPMSEQCNAKVAIHKTNVCNKIKRFCTSYSMCNKSEQICAKQN